MTATIRVARFLQDCAGVGGQSVHCRVLGDGGNGGGSDSLALFGSTEHEGLVNSVNQFTITNASKIEKIVALTV